ncbi:MAG: hypothetical protein JW963_20310 [Anaerolineales bacterium]|nr:hypothetical protein [Anaerolineales bacterium]
MTLITLFSAPKSFTDAHIATIQRNAIKSWTLLPDVEVLLIGDEKGVAEAASELGVKHLPGVKCTENGTPLISSMFQLARENSDSDLLCIVNADMILTPDFIEAARQVQKQKTKFVLLSQRWDLDVTESIDFSDGWQDRQSLIVNRRGQLHRPVGSDFFLFPRTCYTEIPDFAIGRAGWDNWMIYKARQEKWPVIDCTPSVMIIHQNHDYSHLPDGKSHYTHPETDKNIRLAGGPAVVRYTVLDATHRLMDGKLVRPAFSSLRFWRKVELFLRKAFFILPENSIENIARPKRWKKRFKKLFK